MKELSRKLLTSYVNDECDIYLVYGMPEGIGKSSYVLKALAEVRSRPSFLPEDGDWKTDLNKVKPWLKFYPRDVVLLCKRMTDKGRRYEAFIWDDAGLWLNSMEWNDPFVVAFTKYLNIARTNWAGVILTSPDPNWIVRKIRSSEGLIFVKITRYAEERADTKIRSARAYRRWVHPDRKHSGVRSLFEDIYDAMLPDEFYGWYKPIRDSYAKQAVDKMFAVLHKRKDLIGWGETTKDETVLESVRENIAKGNDEAIDFGEALEALEVEK